MALAIEELLKEIAPDSPSGPNLEYDAAYMAVERIAQGRPERQMGNQILPAEEPDWRKLQEGCVELLAKTKDLRVLLYLCVALLKTENLSGLRDGLKLLRGVLEKFWDTVHPQLDPEDDNDPTERVNIIDSLAKPESDGLMKFQQRIREAPLCDSKQVGRFSYRDVAIAKGEIAAVPTSPESKPPDMAGIEAAFMDTDLNVLTADAQAVAQCVEEIKAIETYLTNVLGAGQAPNLSSAVSLLTSIQKILDEYLAKRGVASPSQEAATAAEGAVEAGKTSAATLSGEVLSRQDVLNAIDKITRYYEQYEPSSPVPVILGRVRRLVTMSFMEIITDLAPDAVQQIQVISGVDKSTQAS